MDIITPLMIPPHSYRLAGCRSNERDPANAEMVAVQLPLLVLKLIFLFKPWDINYPLVQSGNRSQKRLRL